MIVFLEHPDCGFGNFKQEMTPNSLIPKLLGAESYSSITNHHEIFIQEYKGEDFTVQHQSAFFRHPFIVKGIIPNEGLYFTTLLQNNIRNNIALLGSSHIRENQFECYYTTRASCEIKAVANKLYRILTVYFDPKLLCTVAPYFPLFNDKLSNNNQFKLNYRSKWLLPSLKRVIQDLFDLDHSEHSRPLFYDIKIHELLFHLLDNAFPSIPSVKKISHWELARINEAANILRNHLDKKPPTIKQLSKMVALNEYKLKYGFQLVFHLPIADWIQDEKLMYARQAIITSSMPIKLIASMVGYPRTTNFITAFRKKFGYTPGSLRR